MEEHEAQEQRWGSNFNQKRVNPKRFLQILSLPLLSLRDTLQINYHPEAFVRPMSYQYTERQDQ